VKDPEQVDHRVAGSRRTLWAMTDEVNTSWADFRDPIEPEPPKRVIHLPEGIGPRESLNLDDPEDVGRLIVFFASEIEEIRVSIARLIDLSG
jgi:hypothetical protein